jgi:hypothetical protein
MATDDEGWRRQGLFRVAQGSVGELVVDPAGSLPVGVQR